MNLVDKILKEEKFFSPKNLSSRKHTETEEFIKILNENQYLDNLSLKNLNIIDLGILEKVNSLYISYCVNLTTLSKLNHTINLNLTNLDNLADLGNLKTVDTLYIQNCNGLRSLNHISECLGNVRIDNCSIESIGTVDYIQGNLILKNCPNLKNFGQLLLVEDYIVIDKDIANRLLNKMPRHLKNKVRLDLIDRI